MPFNVPEEDKPKFNKLVRDDLYDVLNNFQQRAFETVVEESRDPFIDAFNNVDQRASESPDTIYDAVFNDVQQSPLEAVASEGKPSYADSIRRKDIPPGADPRDFIITDPQEIVSTPLDESKVRLLGLVDENFQVTPLGKKFFNLTEAGIFDKNGIITPKGLAYTVKPEDLGNPENIDAFDIQWEDGLIRGESTFGEMKDNLWNLGRSAIYGAGQAVGATAKSAYSKYVGEDDPKAEAGMIATNLAFIEGQSSNIAELARMVDVGMNLLIEGDDQIRDPSEWGKTVESVKKDSKTLRLAQQRQYETRRVIADAGVGQLAEFVTGLEGGVEAAEWARATMGKEAFDETYKNIKTTNELVGGAENLIPAAFAIKLSKTPSIAGRAELLAQKMVGKQLSNGLEKAAIEASLEAAKEAIRKGDIATKLATRFIEKGAVEMATPATIARSAQASEILARTAKITEEAAASIPVLTAKLDELTKTGSKLSTRIPVAAAEATVKAMQAGRSLRALPANTVGSVLEGFGNTLTKVDNAVSGFFKERGLDQMYTAALGMGGVIGLAGNPVVGVIAGGAAALKAGKAIANYGKLFKYVGKTMAEAKGQIPF